MRVWLLHRLVTIYDQKITMTWTATDSEGNTVHGTLVALCVLAASPRRSGWMS